MGFNWKGAARGVVGGMSDRYNAAQEEQREFERWEKMQNVQMMKKQEMSTWQAKQNKQAEQESYDTGLIREEDAYQKGVTRKDAEAVEAEKKRKGLLQGKIDEKISTDNQLSEAETKREMKKTEAKMEQLFPDLEPGTPEYQQKLQQLSGVKAAEKGLTKKEKGDFMKEASKIVTNRTKDLSEAEVLATQYGNIMPKGAKSALSHYRKTMKMEVYSDMVTAGTPGPAVDKKTAVLNKFRNMDPETQAAAIANLPPEAAAQIKKDLGIAEGGPGMLGNVPKPAPEGEKKVSQWNRPAEEVIAEGPDFVPAGDPSKMEGDSAMARWKRSKSKPLTQ